MIRTSVLLLQNEQYLSTLSTASTRKYDAKYNVYQQTSKVISLTEMYSEKKNIGLLPLAD